MILSQLPKAKHNSCCVYSGDQVLQSERFVAKQQNIAIYSLMESAGAAAFAQLKLNFTNVQSILVLCGKGNNGGDGFIVARLAHLAKLQVTVLVTCDIKMLKGDALLAYQHMIAAGITGVITKQLVKQLSDFQGDVIVDALFGIGFHGQLTLQMQQLVSAVNINNAQVLSIDIPSGLCANTGFVNQQHAVVAQVTVTFIVYKLGLLTGQAANFIGKLILADLTLGVAFQAFVTCEHLLQRKPPLLNGISPLKKRLNTSHKGNVGQILAIGGGKGMPGAIRLTSEAALRCGAALVSVCCHQGNQAFIVNGRPELMLAPNEASQLASSSVI
ncbi:MAG: NAD(P)H-hydrate epimerase, partial [Colwellia sp.]